MSFRAASGLVTLFFCLASIPFFYCGPWGVFAGSVWCSFHVCNTAVLWRNLNKIDREFRERMKALKGRAGRC